MKTLKVITNSLIVLFCLFIYGCTKDLTGQEVEVIPYDGNIETLNVPEGFNFRTINETNFQIQLNAPDGNPINGVPVTINELVNDTLIELFTLMTDQNGLAEGLFNVPSGITDLVISPNYVGVPNDIIVPVSGNLVTLTLSGAKMIGATKTWEKSNPQTAVSNTQKTMALLNYKYLSPYNSQGVPSVMATRDVVTAQMLDFINNSVPEREPVPTFHPNYLQNNLNTDLDIIQNSDVWLTFVHEGAGYTNSLGFYKYPTTNPPTSMSQIDTVYLAFPNASYYNSGGGLKSGDKVKIGTFPAGTSIGFVCISNGWNGGGVGNGLFQLFSNKNLNNISNPTVNQQNVLLYDNVNQIYYLGFEDIARTSSGCDNDFNDIVFYAKSNPITAISNVNMPLADNGIDTDGDGVSNQYDEFPNDATLAYINYLPAKGVYGTLAFEDLWPSKGDYDFNDLVVGYQFEQWTNAKNKVKQMKCRFPVRAIGAHFKHAFGFQMNASPSEVAQVRGVEMYDNYISLYSNNTEAGQNLATIIAFDNDYGVVNRGQGNSMNTDPSKTYQSPDTVSLDILFTTPKSQAELGAAPFNPFIVIDGNRGMEVHLAGYKPTSLADTKIFGTSSDNTNFGRDIYYKSKGNLPFAVNIPEDFDYPKEKSIINKAHLNFADWAQSGSAIFNDWYKNISGYRNESEIYSR